jgi:DNA-binding response OmpR family regulator
MNITFKELEINDDEKVCYINNKDIKLTKSEYYLLMFFLLNKDRVFTREELIDNVWNKKISNLAVSNKVSQLRKKLGEYAKYLTTRLGFGYNFKSEV